MERSTYDSVAFRYVAANSHPDHDTIATFRRRFLPMLKGLFVQILMIATEAGVLKIGDSEPGRDQNESQCLKAQGVELWACMQS